MGLTKNKAPPYIVLMGDVGTGKSTIVEKLTGEKGRSSASDESFTKISKPFSDPDGRLVVCDTPGSNPRKEKLEHNTEIAAAFNYDRVSKIFIVTKADTRIDNVVDNIRKYAEQLMEMDDNAMGVLVTHMDTVNWSREQFSSDINEELGLETVVFSSLGEPSKKVLEDILAVCNKRHDMRVDGENFFKIFKINNNNMKIIKTTKKEVEEYRELKNGFYDLINEFPKEDHVDLVFDFQAWMEMRITDAQQRMSEEHGFTFYGDQAANEAAHVANMTNQLRVTLHDLRIFALGYQSEHGVNVLRKCPHCGLVWAKFEGCDDATSCGARPSNKHDLRSGNNGVMSTFTFNWLEKKLNIVKSGSKKVLNLESSSTSKVEYGCGKTITWRSMQPVEVPSAFQAGQVKIKTDDVKVIPEAASGVEKKVTGLIKAAETKMHLGPN